jgi:hypothetical protein
MKLFNNYKKILIIGAGSGADILSSLLIVNELKNKNNIIDLAGFLTPWAVHYFDNLIEKPINIIKDGKNEKVKLGKTNISLPFFETTLHKLNKGNKLGVNKMFLFSLQKGTKVLKKNIEKIINKEGYDLILVVDVGGDILVDKANLKDIFTPIVDISCLNIFSNIKTKAKKYLIVIAPGIDGELKTKNLKLIIKKYEDNNKLIFTKKLSSLKSDYFLKASNSLNKVGFTNHTPKIIKKIINNNLKNKEVYCKKSIFNNFQITTKYEVLFNKYLVNNIFCFKLKDIFDNCPIKEDYSNLQEAFLLFKNKAVGGTEIDLSYIFDKNKKLVFILNYNYLLSENQKIKLKKEINNNLSNNIKIISAIKKK